MKQNKTYLHLGVTLIVSACAVLMFYDTFFQSRVLLDFFDKLMQVLSPVIYWAVEHGTSVFKDLRKTVYLIKNRDKK
mgnify:FL=1